MAEDVKKLTPFNDGARRRMIMKNLTSVAILPGGRGANPESNVTFFKSAEKQGGKRDDETEAQFRARLRREREASKQEEGTRRRRRRRGDKDYEKQDGPREGESFTAFLARMRESDSTMTRERARAMFDGDAEKGAGDLVDLVTSVDEGHQHGISVNIYDDQVSFFTSYAGQDRESTHDHQMVRNDDGSYSILENFGHTHDDIEADQIMNIIGQRMLEKEAAGEKMPEEGHLADLLAAAKEGKVQPPEGDPEMADNKELDALKAQVATLTAVAALNGAHKTHYDTLDEAAKAEFLKMDADAKDASIKAAEAQKSEADPVVYKAADGTEFRKSDGDKAVEMAKRNDDLHKRVAKMEAREADTELTKRAEDLKFIPGDVDVRKAMIKALDGIEDEDVRKKAHEAIKAVNRDNSPLFKTIGSGGQPVQKAESVDEAEAELERLAKARAEKEGEDFYTAYEKVSEANPDLLKKAMG